MASVALTLFAHVCSRPEAELDLGEAALLIATAERPALDVGHYVRCLDDIGRAVSLELVKTRGPEERVTIVVRHLYEALGYRGNDTDYYDPRNSFLDDVIDRRTGIPITLAVVLLEVCRRVDVDARGVSFPGHFLVRAETPRGTIVVDPFTGRQLSRDELRVLYSRATGQRGDTPARLLEPAAKAQILARMLHNLRAIYEQRGDDRRLVGILERLHVLAPSDELAQRIEALGGQATSKPRGSALN
jgi:regulator of sirC expression with transglutaminase-like and TPR domain